jgi:hypothetical protein
MQYTSTKLSKMLVMLIIQSIIRHSNPGVTNTFTCDIAKSNGELAASFFNALDVVQEDLIVLA